MLRLGLTAAQYRSLVDTLSSAHERRIRVQLLSRNTGRILSELTPKVVDGQVTIDTTRTPSRMLDLTLLDESRSLHFDADATTDTPFHVQRLVRVFYLVRVPALEDWLEIPVFSGPIMLDGFQRVGAEVTIRAEGKERLLMGHVWKPRTFEVGMRKTTVMRTIAREAGERALVIPDLPAKLPRRVTLKHHSAGSKDDGKPKKKPKQGHGLEAHAADGSGGGGGGGGTGLELGRMATALGQSRKLASSMDRQLFHAANGNFTLRHIPNKPVYTIKDTLLSDVTVKQATTEFANTFEVLGGKPKGSKTRVRAVEFLPKSHPLSPWSLAVNGELYYVVNTVENDKIRSRTEAQAKARRMRDDAARIETEFEFDCMPIPMLEERDLVKVVSPTDSFLVRMQRWSIPLGSEGDQPMTVGYIRRTTKPKRQRPRPPRGRGGLVALPVRPPPQLQAVPVRSR
jgi:hypothetical protein